ncbi:MAG: hypothetical protein AAGD35_08430 [Actinomycetota bacterium]
MATTEAQGARPHDVADAVEGELVYVPASGCIPPVDDGMPCAADGCSCHLAFVGMASNRPTTTALVVDRPDLSDDDLWTALSDSLERQGRLGDGASNGGTSNDDVLAFRMLFRRTLATAEHFSSGSVIERDGDHIHRRAQTEPLSVPSDLIGDA